MCMFGGVRRCFLRQWTGFEVGRGIGIGIGDEVWVGEGRSLGGVPLSVSCGGI